MEWFLNLHLTLLCKQDCLIFLQGPVLVGISVLRGSLPAAPMIAKGRPDSGGLEVMLVPMQCLFCLFPLLAFCKPCSLFLISSPHPQLKNDNGG